MKLPEHKASSKKYVFLPEYLQAPIFSIIFAYNYDTPLIFVAALELINLKP